MIFLISLGLWILYLAFCYRSLNSYYDSPLASPIIMTNFLALTHLLTMVFLDLHGYYSNHALLLGPPLAAALLTTVALLFACKSPRWPLTALASVCIIVLAAEREFIPVLLIAAAAQVEAYSWAMRRQLCR